MRIHRVTVRHDGGLGRSTISYLGEAGSVETAVRKVLRIARKDGLRKPRIAMVEDLGNKDFSTCGRSNPVAER